MRVGQRIPTLDCEWAVCQIRSIVAQVDAHRFGQAAGADPGFGGAYENAAWSAFWLDNNVEHVMDSVVEIDVSVTGRAEDYLGAFSETGTGVGGFVAHRKISLGFRNTGAQFAVDEPLAEQVSRDKRGWPGKEATI